jgi:hypothetical protein
MQTLKKAISRHQNNYRGWRTSRKIVVIESDDWGSICMPSPEIHEKLIRDKYRIDLCPYATYDSLASEDDLRLLFSALADYRDNKGNHPVITANTVMTNPDFLKIRDSGFTGYYYELFTDTLKSYPQHTGSFDLWKQGMRDRLFYPQFHGREHVNINAWLVALQDAGSMYQSVFKHNVCWLGPSQNESNQISVRASYDTNQIEEIENHKQALREGLSFFESIFGYTSKSFIAPNFIYHPDLEPTLSEMGVRYIQGMKYQKLPLMGNDSRAMVRHFQGEKNGLGQYYLVRNCVFEPSQYPEHHDNVGECLKGIRNAFFWKKPAIITTHRLNFIGFIHPENRERNLEQFRELLRSILKKWPDVEFMTSAELGDEIAASDNNG